MTTEKTLQTYLQNKIAKQLFGIDVDLPITTSLTSADVEKAHGEINKLRKVYYCVSNHVPTKDEQAKSIYYFINDTVFLHQDNIHDFINQLERAGYLAQDVKKLSREDQIQRIVESLNKEMNT